MVVFWLVLGLAGEIEALLAICSLTIVPFSTSAAASYTAGVSVSVDPDTARWITTLVVSLAAIVLACWRLKRAGDRARSQSRLALRTEKSRRDDLREAA